ncbi:MAG: alpha-L-rhamnosidase [Muribaculaceae bacterium]|nr:alpha-L-rhamnosidase [Muribaculaceae bacterium]
MKFISVLTTVALGMASLNAMAGLPRVFTAEGDTARVKADALSRAYITPTRVVLTEGGVTNPELLLVPGSGQTDIFNSGMCQLSTVNDSVASIVLDFGRELHGSLRLLISAVSPLKTPHMRLRFGESVAEACSELTTAEISVAEDFNNSEVDLKANTATNDHAIRDMVLTLPFYGQYETGNTGYRFVRIDLLDSGMTVNLKEATAILRYRDLPYKGSFKSSDPKLNKIWDTGAYTVHLNMQEYLWDGIKRDRLIWLGDMHPETSTIAAVFGCDPSVEATLDLACEQWPLPQWFNGMSAYSLWYLIIHHDWYKQSGNKEFLDRHAPYITALIDRIDTLVDEDGTERLSEDRFLDWPSSPNKEGVEAGYRALMTWAMKDAEQLCNYIGDKNRAEKARDIIRRLDKKKMPHNDLKQAASLMAIAGVMDPKIAAEDCIAVDGPKGFSTFGGYYMLEALAKAGLYDEAMDIIRTYWGGMLDLGATTFWEDFDLDWTRNAGPIDRLPAEGEDDIHGDFGAYCYPGFRHSLCHGWASGPTAWMSRHVLGVEVLDPGCTKVRINPHLGDLEWVEGTYPTPQGEIKISHRRKADGSIDTKVEAPKGVKIVK